jgi:NAD(P)-dependent dehydrogenase (short-subunit alcohol dehydrogenase family)
MNQIAELISLKGKISLVTGSSGHLGSYITETLCDLGSDVILLDCDIESLTKQHNHLKNKYETNVHIIHCNLEDDSDKRKISSSLSSITDRLDVLVNNAAFVGTSQLDGWCTTFSEQSDETWRRAFEVNLTSVFQLCKSCLPLLTNSGSASVINIGSIYADLGPDMSLYCGTMMGNPAAYSASKAGLIQLTRWLATVLAPSIRVNAISPGGIYRQQDHSFVERYKARTPLQRMGRESDIQGALAYLATDMSSWVTGQNLHVDGGWGIW